MYSHLLKKALPFTLTLVVGAALGGLFNPRGERSPSWASWHCGRYEFGSGERRGHDHCRMRRRYLVAESKPLTVLSTPDAVLTHTTTGALFMPPAHVLVTFGSDGNVQAVEPLDDYAVKAKLYWPTAAADPLAADAWQAVERAARQIRFEPETINGMPVSVTKEVEIRFAGH
ncbi:MAG TPA: hypothetical protein VJ866_19005 [Pyrinomonadaceae bacterium]|nr:hypothetical protein [Pyrinomonadaceae bacterium]